MQASACKNTFLQNNSGKLPLNISQENIEFDGNICANYVKFGNVDKYVFSDIGLPAIVSLSVIVLIATPSLLRAFKSKVVSNSINNTNSENASVSGKINEAENYEVVAKYIKVEKIKKNTRGQKKERYKNIKKDIEGQIRKQDTLCKKVADKQFKTFVENLLKFDPENIKDYKDIKGLECEFVSNF